MLGCLDEVHDGLDGVRNAANRTNTDGHGATFRLTATTERQVLDDPAHDHHSVLKQLATTTAVSSSRSPTSSPWTRTSFPAGPARDHRHRASGQLGRWPILSCSTWLLTPARPMRMMTGLLDAAVDDLICR
jgi:hypothetical protein